MQSVYDTGAKAELIQAIGRARLVSHGKKVFLWCSHELPTITDREQTHLFTERDIEKWTDDNTATLENIISERETTDKEIAAAEKAGDTKALQQATGVSERTARRKTENTRKTNKAARDAEIMRLHQEGQKQSDIVLHISKHFGKINQGAVSRVIQKNMQNGRPHEGSS